MDSAHLRAEAMATALPRRVVRAGEALVTYSTIVVDPPWQVKAGTLKGREGWHDAQGSPADLKYPTLSLEQIRSLPISDVAATDAHLYLWTINKYLPHAFDLIRS